MAHSTMLHVRVDNDQAFSHTVVAGIMIPTQQQKFRV